MLIYRIERKDNRVGPFISMGWEFMNGYQKPTPYNDEGIGDKFKERYHKCGCSSFSQLLEWINTDKLHFAKDDYVISEYDIDDCFVIQGQFQVVFEWKRAKLVYELPINEVC